MLAARALHTRLCDAARLYLEATKAARASLWTLEQVLPGTEAYLEERREAFSALLQVEFAVLADRARRRRRPLPRGLRRRAARRAHDPLSPARAGR